MKICYIDEAGDGRQPSARNQGIPPVLAICGLVVESRRIGDLTRAFLDTKARFHPGKAGLLPLDGILCEVKGSDVRRDIRSGSRRKKRAAMGFLDEILKLLDNHDAGLIGRVWIKGPHTVSNEQSMYIFSIQDIGRHFQHDLAREKTTGIIICDSRSKAQNANVAHSMFTRMFKRSGNDYPELAETPVFGHSDNHAGLQLADLVTSALVFPIACRTYCQGIVTGAHVNPNYDDLKRRYGRLLQRRQVRYRTANGRWVGGLMVSDPVNEKSSAHMFR